MPEDVARVSWVYEVGIWGTPPYVTSMDFENDDAPDGGDVAVLLNGCVDAWNDNIVQFISSTLGGGHADLKYQRTADVLEVSTAIAPGDDGAGTLQTMGFSYRLRKEGTRPTNGRKGSMYVMGARTDGFDGSGAIDTGAIQTAVTTFFDDLLAISGWHPVQVHNVDSVETLSTVLALTVMPTVSFLRRRYR